MLRGWTLGRISVLRLARVLANGFAGIPFLEFVFGFKSPELFKVLRRVPSSWALLPPASDSAPNGSSDVSPSELSGDKRPAGGGDTMARAGGEKKRCVPFSTSDEAECGEIMRTVLPVLDFETRGMSALRQ